MAQAKRAKTLNEIITERASKRWSELGKPDQVELFTEWQQFWIDEGEKFLEEYKKEGLSQTAKRIADILNWNREYAGLEPKDYGV